MTKITFFRRNGVYFGFEESGHAGFDDAGRDILCAAISAMTMLVVNAIEVSYESPIDYTIDEDTAVIRVMANGALPDHEPDERKRYAISGLIRGYYLQLCDMLEDYYDYLEVCETDA